MNYDYRVCQEFQGPAGVSEEEIGRMLNSMMEKADSFCGSPDGVLREDASEYFEAAPPLATDN
jgi:hypothetical protein